jgi:hypothetical protein
MITIWLMLGLGLFGLALVVQLGAKMAGRSMAGKSMAGSETSSAGGY